MLTLPIITWPILLALAAGLLTFLAPRLIAKWFALLVSAGVAALCITLFIAGPGEPWKIADTAILQVDHLSLLILLGIGVFGFLMTTYSAGFFTKTGPVSDGGFYYANILLSIGAACGIALSGNLLILAVFWGLLSIPLYLLISAGSSEGPAVAKKTLMILGATDSILVLGLATFALCNGTLSGLELNSFHMFNKALTAAGTAALPYWFSLICIIIAALAKAGAMPFHSWVPDAAKAAPVPVVAMLPASMDKLLGVYLLARVFLMFEIPTGFRIALLLLGAGTIMFAVMSAMTQHNLRKLLGFHAVSQVGYMIIGVSTGNPIGMIGGIFHLFNNAIYKSCLFLTAGAAERKTGETELDKMGGLAKTLPLTFIAALIAAMSISGIPPLSGFASKWMIYNGIIAAQDTIGPVWIIILIAAMFGSALTLASFIKVLHSVFLGQPKQPTHPGPNPGLLMKLPMLALAALCIVMGVFAVRLVVQPFILPIVGLAAPDLNAEILGEWSSRAATAFLLIALVIGGLIYLFSTFIKAREDNPFICGEVGDRAAGYNFEGIEFFKTVRNMSLVRALYRRSEQKWYDIHDQLGRLALYITGWLRKLHNGSLHSYVTWCIIGLVTLLWWLMYSYGVFGRAF